MLDDWDEVRSHNRGLGESSGRGAAQWWLVPNPRTRKIRKGPPVVAVVAIVVFASFLWWESQPTSWHPCPSLLTSGPLQESANVVGDYYGFSVEVGSGNNCPPIPMPAVNGSVTFSECGGRVCTGYLYIYTSQQWQNLTDGQPSQGYVWCYPNSQNASSQGTCASTPATNFSTEAASYYLKDHGLYGGEFVLAMGGLAGGEISSAIAYSQSDWSPPPP